MGAARIVQNPLARGQGVQSPAPAEVLSFHRSLSGYAPTRLVDAPSIADALGVTRVWIKDESERLGMPSFKILGASWAAFRALCEHLDLPSTTAGIDALRQELASYQPLTLVAATDGNHGRAVAHIASVLGLQAHILVPADMVETRREAIRSEGAQVTIVEGGYDDAVARSAGCADSEHLVISDTSWPGYEDVPRWVIDGYATIALEIDEELHHRRAPRTPDVLAVQIGVGAFAAAMVRHFKPTGALLVGVEPVAADCVTASIEAGRPVSIPGPQDSIMAGLNCGRPSLVAWPVISQGLDVLAVIEDDRAREAMRLLASAGVVSGESGAAGLAGLLDLAERGHLPAEATVLVVSTEGSTDPEAYRAIVGGASSSGSRAEGVRHG